MARCTEPELWEVVPDWNAPDELIEQYLQHLNDCAYHAEVERRRTNAVRLTFDAARSVTENGALTFSDQEEAAALDALARLDAVRTSGAKIIALTFKVDGKKVGSLDFAEVSRMKKKINRKQPLQIYGRTGEDEPELLLATYVPAAQDRAGSYTVTLNDQQSLRLNVRPVRRAKVQVTISRADVPQDQGQGLFARFVSGSRLVPALGVLGLLLIGIGFIAVRYIFENKNSNKNAVYTARNNEPNYEPSIAMTTPSSSIPNSQPPTQGVGAGQPVTSPGTGTRPTPTSTLPHTSGGLRSSGQRVEEITSLQSVHKLFVDEQPEQFGQVLRTALIKRLDELGFITRVGRAESDARLRIKWESGNNITFLILSGNHELLNFKTEYADRTPEAAETIALKLKERIQAKLK